MEAEEVVVEGVKAEPESVLPSPVVAVAPAAASLPPCVATPTVHAQLVAATTCNTTPQAAQKVKGSWRAARAAKMKGPSRAAKQRRSTGGRREGTGKASGRPRKGTSPYSAVALDDLWRYHLDERGDVLGCSEQVGCPSCA